MQRVLLECAIRAALIAGGTAVVLGVTRVKTAAARHVAWAAVVVMMLTLPVWTAWGPKAPLRVLPAAAVTGGSVIPAAGVAIGATAGGSAPEVSATAVRVSSWNGWTWAAGVYLLGVVTLIVVLPDRRRRETGVGWCGSATRADHTWSVRSRSAP